MNSIQTKLVLIFIVGLLLASSLTGFIVVKYEKFLTSIIQLSDKTYKIQNSAYKSQVYFKTQIQEWKNTLLRGYDKNLYNKYYNSFLQYENKTISEVKHLSTLAKEYPELKSNAMEFIIEHKKLSALYREGLLIYSKTKQSPQIVADKHVRGIDREPIKLLSQLVKNSKKINETEKRNIESELKRIKNTVMYLYVLTFISIIVFFWFSVKRGVSQPFNEEIRRKHKLAMTDGLTGIFNRHAYNERISVELHRYARSKRPFTLLLFDIDKFKAINDTFGHEAGDRVIVDIAKVLEDNIRVNDFVARYGGEEFVLLLRDANINSAEIIANKLRELIERTEFHFSNKRVVLTVSAGFAEIRAGETKNELFQRADTALYKAKNLGRNKCIGAQE